MYVRNVWRKHEKLFFLLYIYIYMYESIQYICKFSPPSGELERYLWTSCRSIAIIAHNNWHRSAILSHAFDEAFARLISILPSINASRTIQRDINANSLPVAVRFSRIYIWTNQKKTHDLRALENIQFPAALCRVWPITKIRNNGDAPHIISTRAAATLMWIN